MVPTKDPLEPIVTAVPTAQYTLHALAPLMRMIDVDDPVMTVVAVWNTQTDELSPLPSRVRDPVVISIMSSTLPDQDSHPIDLEWRDYSRTDMTEL
jgi:hypothetical protein